MDKVIVYVDDAAHALGVLQPLLAGPPAPRQWIVLACAPRVTQHVSKWVTHSARANWRGKWADKLFAQLVPRLREAGVDVHTCLGTGNLAAQTQDLLDRHGPARVIDARRPKLGLGLVPPAAGRPLAGGGVLGLFLTLGGLALPLVSD